MKITQTERRQRMRYVRGGDWDDAVIFLEGNRQIHSWRSTINSDGQLVCEVGPEEDRQMLTLDIADVTRVVR